MSNIQVKQSLAPNATQQNQTTKAGVIEIERKTSPNATAIIMNSIKSFIAAFEGTPTPTTTSSDTPTTVAQSDKPVEISEINVLGKQIAENLTSPIGEFVTYLFSADSLNDLQQTGNYLVSGSVIDDASSVIQNTSEYITSGEIVKDIESGVDYVFSGKIASDMASGVGQNIISEDTFQNGELAAVMAKNAGLNGDSSIKACQTFLDNSGVDGNHSECINLMHNCVSIVTGMKLTNIKSPDQFATIDDTFKNDNNPITESIFTKSTIEAGIETLKTNQTSKGMKVLYGILKAVASTVLLIDTKTTGIIKKTINNKIKDKLKSMVIKSKFTFKNLEGLQKALSELKENTQPDPTKQDNKTLILESISNGRKLSDIPDQSSGVKSQRSKNDSTLANLLLKNYTPDKPPEKQSRTEQIVTSFLKNI